MASVVTVVSRFCYRSPTRPLFVAGLIFLILITWKFLVTQPDANALMMHSKADKTWSGRRKQARPEQLHAPLQSPVKKNEERKRLVNKLNNHEDLEDVDKQEKQGNSGYKSDKFVEGEAQDGGKVDRPAHNSKQSQFTQHPNMEGNAKRKDLAINKDVVIEEASLKINQKQDMTDNQSEKLDMELNEKQQNEIPPKNKQKGTHNNSQEDELKENVNKEQQVSNKDRQKLVKNSSINHAGLDQHLDATKEEKIPSNMKGITPSTTNIISTDSTQNITEYEFPVGQYNILLTLVKMSPNSHLAQSMRKFLKSVCRYTSIKLTLHAVVDDIGKMVVQDVFKTVTGICRETQVVIHNVDKVVSQLKPLTKLLQEYFGIANSYYNDPIFFMSTAIHKVFHKKLKQVIMMDVDLRFVSDIKLLFNMFNNFKESNIIGIAREQSPVYRHILYKYRDAHKGTLVGDPPPKGITGFNSGVVLFNLDNMRKSTLYNRILEGQEIKRLSDKFSFRGHLGDQDFFTLLSAEYPDLFYTIPCSWNRQLCKYWKHNGYAEVWDQYWNCSDPIHVYHGNCRTPFPVDDMR